MTVRLIDRRGKELRVEEDQVDTWLGYGYRRAEPVKKAAAKKTAPAKK